MRLKKETTMVLAVDYQEKLMPARKPAELENL